MVANKLPKQNCGNNANLNDNPHEITTVFGVLKMMVINFSRETIFFIIILLVLFLYLWNKIDYCGQQFEQLCGDFITLFACVLGLTITGYSIIIALPPKTVRILSVPYKNYRFKFLRILQKNGGNPYQLLCSSFSICCIFLIISIVALVLFRNHPSYFLDCREFVLIIKGLCITSVLLVLDIIFHLYCVSTYVYSDSKNQKKDDSEASLNIDKE